MNLDESFTAKLLKRSKARKDYLKVKMMDSSARRKRNTLIEDQQIPNEDYKELRKSTKCLYMEQVGLELEVKEEDLIEEIKENVSLQEQEMKGNNFIKEDEPIEEKVPFNAKGLAALRKKHFAQDGLNESFMPQGTQLMDKSPTYVSASRSRGLCSTRNRLARLAADINGWEDNLTRSSVPTISSSKDSPASEAEETEDTLNSSFEPSKLPLSARRAIFEQAAMENAMVAGINCRENNLALPVLTATSWTKQVVAEEVEDTLNSSFEPSNLPLSARKAIFEQAAKGNKLQSEKQTFKPKVSVARQAALFEKSPKNKFRFRTHHQKPINTLPVRPSTDVKSPLKPAAPLGPTKPSVLKGSPARQYDVSTRRPTIPSTRHSARQQSSTLTRSSSKPYIASTKSPARPSAASTRSPTNPSIASTGHSTRQQSATLTRSSFKPSIASTKSPARVSAGLNRNPGKQTIASTKNPVRPSSALTRSPACPSSALTGSPAKLSSTFSHNSPTQPRATGGCTSTPKKSFIPKLPISYCQQQWTKATDMEPKNKLPLSSLVKHWEKLSLSSSCTNRKSEKATKTDRISKFK